MFEGFFKRIFETIDSWHVEQLFLWCRINLSHDDVSEWFSMFTQLYGTYQLKIKMFLPIKTQLRVHTYYPKTNLIYINDYINLIFSL